MDHTHESHLHDHEVQATERAPKKTYSPPELHDFGTIRDLTLSQASGSMADGGSYPNSIS